MDRKKSVLIAGLLSLIAPSFGKFYLGKIKMAIWVFVLYNICSFAFYASIDNFLLFTTSLSITVVLYLGNSIHSILLARKIKNEAQSFKPKWYIYAGYVFLYLMLAYEVRKPLIEKYFSMELALISSISMDPSLFPGDYIAFNKKAEIQNGDMVVFDDFNDSISSMAHRIVGSPGNLIELKNGKLIRNNLDLNEKNIRLRFFISHENLVDINRFLQEFDITEAFELGDNKLMIHISPENLNKLDKDPRIKEISTRPLVDLAFPSDLFPNSALKEFSWSLGNYGPIRVPKKDWKVELDSVNSDLYQSCILEENPELEFKNHQILENGRPLLSYKFKSDYYFALGDNRYNSLDSRYLGFLSKKKVKGKIMYRYWSNDWGKIGTEF